MKKYFIRSFAVLMLMLGIATVSNGMTLFYANKGRDGIKVFVEASFTPSVETNTTKYGLKKGKYVKKVKIRLKEGNYDQSKTSKDGSFIRLSKTNNPLKTSSGSWTWTYK